MGTLFSRCPKSCENHPSFRGRLYGCEAEYSNDTVVRLYETKNFRAKTTINFGFDVSEVYLADLNEKAQKKLTVKNNSVVLDVKPFEIITLLVK
jgi:alpha-mannosidase